MELRFNKPVREPRREAEFDLFTEILRTYGEAKLGVTGTSMLPAIWPHDVLSVRNVDAGEMFPGDIVVFRGSGGIIAHRLVERTTFHKQIHWVTRGDSLDGDDLALTSDDLLGRVTAVQRGAQSFAPQRSLRNRLASWVLCRSEVFKHGLLRLRKLSVRYTKSRRRAPQA